MWTFPSSTRIRVLFSILNHFPWECVPGVFCAQHLPLTTDRAPHSFHSVWNHQNSNPSHSLSSALEVVSIHKLRWNFPICDVVQLLFFNIFIDYAITVVPFHHPFTPLHPAHLLPPTFPPYTSCPLVILISSLASTFPILFLPSRYFLPTIYATYSLYLSPLSPPPTPLLKTHHVISISVVLFLL